MKYQSKPQLELQPALYGTRLKQFTVDDHDVDIEHFLKEFDNYFAMVAGGDRKQPVVAANIVTQILDSFTIDQCRHVGKTLNPLNITT